MMKPFSAWIAMGVFEPAIFAWTGGFRYEAFRDEKTANRRATNGEPQRVLIIEDTKENRRKLGMEE